MNSPDNIAVIGAVVAVASALFSIIALVVTIYFERKARQHERHANLIAMGQAETELRSAISSTRARSEDVALRIEEVVNGRLKDQLGAQDKRRLEILDKALRSATEEWLNAYENACSLYLDGKIDKERFKTTYFQEIQHICLQGECIIFELMKPEHKFRTIRNVYREWFIHE